MMGEVVGPRLRLVPYERHRLFLRKVFWIKLSPLYGCYIKNKMGIKPIQQSVDPNTTQLTILKNNISEGILLLLFRSDVNLLAKVCAFQLILSIFIGLRHVSKPFHSQVFHKIVSGPTENIVNKITFSILILKKIKPLIFLSFLIFH